MDVLRFKIRLLYTNAGSRKEMPSRDLAIHPKPQGAISVSNITINSRPLNLKFLILMHRIKGEMDRQDDPHPLHF